MNAATVARQGARGTRLLAVNEFGLVSHHAAGDLPLSAGLAMERQCYESCLTSEDRKEALAAFAEKRRPHYLGK